MNMIDKIKRLVPGSAKPYSKTTVDAIVATIVSVVVTFLLILVWTGREGLWVAVAQAALLAFILQFAYEYLGVNAMIYESSARYMRGVTLDKFSSVTGAKCYLEYNKLHNMSTDADYLAKLDVNLDVLEAIIKQLAVRKLLKNFPEKPDEMSTKEYDDVMAACSGDVKKYQSIIKLTDILDEYVIYWLLLNGFENTDKANVHLLAYKDGLARLEADLAKPTSYINNNYGSISNLNKSIQLLRRELAESTSSVK